MSRPPHQIVELLAAYASPQAHRSCPSWARLDLFRLHELPIRQNRETAAHIATCKACKQRLIEEERSFRTVFEPNSWTLRQSGSRLTTPITGAPPPTRVLPVLVIASIAAAAMLVLAPHLDSAGALFGGAMTSSASPTTRRKGVEHMQLSAFREHRGKVEQMFPGAMVAPGDRVRFQIGAANDLHFMIVGVEESGQLFSYYPLDGRGRSARHEGGQVLLDGAAEMDASLGRESIVLVGCPRPFEMAALHSGIPADCQSEGFTIYKAAQ